MRAQELDVVDLDRVLAPDRTDDARHRVGTARATERDAGVVEVDAIQGGGEAIGVALAPDLAVGEDVQAGLLLRLDRCDGGVVLCLGEKRLGNAPQLLCAHARRQALQQLLTVDQPLGLRVAADERGGEQHRLASFSKLSTHRRHHSARSLTVLISDIPQQPHGERPRRMGGARVG